MYSASFRPIGDQVQETLYDYMMIDNNSTVHQYECAHANWEVSGYGSSDGIPCCAINKAVSSAIFTLKASTFCSRSELSATTLCPLLSLPCLRGVSGLGLWGRSAAGTSVKCWDDLLVLDLDKKGFFDTIPIIGCQRLAFIQWWDDSQWKLTSCQMSLTYRCSFSRADAPFHVSPVPWTKMLVRLHGLDLAHSQIAKWPRL